MRKRILIMEGKKIPKCIYSHKRLQSMHGNLNSNSLTNLRGWNVTNNKHLRTLSELNDLSKYLLTIIIVQNSNDDNTNEEYAFNPSSKYNLNSYIYQI